MINTVKITAPLTDDQCTALNAGDRVLLSGPVYTARDLAHGRLIRLLEDGSDLPFDPAGQIIYYTGPAPAKKGKLIGPAGPTTAGRMDPFTPRLLQAGLKGMIGKGTRSKEVVEAIRKHRAVYFGAVGGTAALLAERIQGVETIAFPDLGTEAILRLELDSFPVIVAIDSRGNNLYSL